MTISDRDAPYDGLDGDVTSFVATTEHFVDALARLYGLDDETAATALRSVADRRERGDRRG